MKILYFHQHFSTPKGAAGTRSYEMAKQLIARGHEVTMVCGSYAQANTNINTPFKNGVRNGVVENIKIIEFELNYSNSDSFLRRTLTFFRFSMRSTKLIFTEKFDLVFATTTPLTAGIPGIFARWFFKKTFVFEVRDLWPELPKAMGVVNSKVILGLMSFLEWLSYRSAHRCIGLSPGIVDGIASKGVPRDRIALIPNGCDFDIFSPDIDAQRPKEVDNSELLAVFTGTHGQANGLHAVLDAASILKERGRDDIKLMLVGQGKLKGELEKRANHEKLHNIIFADPMDKENLAKLMAGADLGMQILANVRAFYYGTSPNKFFDYISAGLPVLINYPGWLADLIETSDSGFVVPPDNPVEFANALEKAACDKAGLKKKGLNARRLAEVNFERGKLAKEFVDWLEIK